MRLSTLRTRSLGLVLAGAVGALLVACGDAPTDPAPQFGHIGGGEGHPTPPTIAFIEQPEVSFHSTGTCRIDFSFVVENAKQRVFFRTRWIGGDHPGVSQFVWDADTEELIFGPAAHFNGMEIFGVRFHDNDGDSFDKLRIEVWNARTAELLAEDDSTIGGTSSC